MRIKEILKIYCLKSNPYWPFSYLNKIPYYLVIKAVIWQCKKFPEIKSVYLTHGLAEGGWVAGLSDIDFLIIIADGLSAKEEWSFLNRFFGRVGRIKKIFPLIHWNIFSRSELQKSVSWGYQSYRAQYQKLFYGQDTVKKNYDPDVLRNDALYYAFKNFYLYSGGKFFSANYPPWSALKEFGRLSQKIIGVCEYYSRTKELNHTNRTMADSYSAVIKALDELVVEGPKQNVHKFNEFKVSTIDMQHGPGYFKVLNAACMEELTKYTNRLDLKAKECIAAIIFLYKGCPPYIMLRDNLSNNELVNFLTDIRNIVIGLSLDIPFIITEKIFKNSIRLYDPIWYYRLHYYGTALHGKNIINELIPPDEGPLINYALRNILELPRALRQYFHRNLSCTRRLTTPDGNDFLSYVIQMKLLLERGIIVLCRETLLKEWEKYFPDSYRKAKEAILPRDKFYFIKDQIEALSEAAYKQLKRSSA